jgi:hypothetical protein
MEGAKPSEHGDSTISKFYLRLKVGPCFHIETEREVRNSCRILNENGKSLER